MADMNSWLEKLNKEQKEAVLENSHPLLVLAGAGSGKTRVITTKIAYCINELGIRPWNILAVTFTNKAAAEMKERVLDMLPNEDPLSFNIRTFHSFGVWLLRRFYEEAGLQQSFTIYDDSDSLSLLRSIYPSRTRKELSPIMKSISKAKDMGLTPFSPDLDKLNTDPLFRRYFENYEKALRSVGNVDFADLISLPTKLLTENAEILSFVHRRFKVILVDEYQDSNIAQFELLKKLTGPSTFICVVGDDDQSIYRFRGAEVKNILSFPKIFPGTKQVVLSQNYRSTKNILDLASTVIANNTFRHKKILKTENPNGSKPKLYYVNDENDEALQVLSFLRKEKNLNDSAILYRTNAQSMPFETLLIKRKIPYKIVGALKFFEREEIKDALALLQLFMNSRDIVNFRRMINKPARGIGPTSVNKIEQFLPEVNGDIFEAIEKACDSNVLTARCKNSAKSFVDLMLKSFDKIKNGNLSEGVNFLLSESGLIDYYKQEDLKNKTFKSDNLNSLVNEISNYESSMEGLSRFLEEITLDRTKIGTNDPSEEDGVTLITAHNTKGLEFKNIFLVGLEEGLFPSSMSSEEEDGIEEERRLFYVAVTRAKENLYLFSACARRVWGRMEYDRKPSRFLDEIKDEQIEVIGNRPVSWSDKADKYLNNKGNWGLLDEKRFTHAPRHGSFEGRSKAIDSFPFPEEASSLIHSGFKDNKFKFENKNDQSFKVGERVRNDSYGDGTIQTSTKSNDREVITVKFDNGKVAKYISKYAKLKKI